MKIKEVIKPFIFFPQLALCFLLAYQTAELGSIYFGLLTVALSWQLGWSMKIVKFVEDEKKSNEKENIQ